MIQPRGTLIRCRTLTRKNWYDPRAQGSSRFVDPRLPWLTCEKPYNVRLLSAVPSFSMFRRTTCGPRSSTATIPSRPWSNQRRH
ncbi:hypothetical protein ACFFX0_31170 [Citricoccus parietis]|uniref:Uncharacterized protein n=1 Tax=Citricoccus parietis TaxID=592307 RepID=A0ABV5G8W4_9MICC